MDLHFIVISPPVKHGGGLSEFRVPRLPSVSSHVKAGKNGELSLFDDAGL